MVISTAISLFDDDDYKPHDYIKKSILLMGDYCLPYGQVKIANPETGVIVALILFLIAKEPTVNHTKLECYIILLNRMVKEATGTELFKWQPNKRRRIGSFKKFFDYMTSHSLIKLKGRSNFAIRDNAKSLLHKLSLTLSNLLPYLSKLLTKYEDCTAGEMLMEI